jgi:hypothetical protein
MEKIMNNIRQTRLAVLLDLHERRGWPTNSGFRLLVTKRRHRKNNGTFSLPGIPYPDTRWTAARSTGLSPPITERRDQVWEKFQHLVDILFNENGEWTNDRIQRAISLIKGGARIAAPPNFSPPNLLEHEVGVNMKIWENLEGNCIADKWAPWPSRYDLDNFQADNSAATSQRRREWRINAQRDGYRNGWDESNLADGIFAPDVLNENNIPIGPYGQLIPPGAPPRVARLEFIAALEAFRALRPEREMARAQAQIRIRRALDAVNAQIGWEMPGGDLMVMVVKKKIPLAIIRTLLDYGMHTKFMPAAFNDYERARRNLPTYQQTMQTAALVDELVLGAALPVSSFMIARWDDHYYDNYFHPGDHHANPRWGVMDFGKTGGIHFIIKQYAFGCLDPTQHMDADWGGTIKPGMERDYKYYTDLLKLIFRRHLRIVGEEGALDNRGDPIIPGMRYVPNAIIDSPAYQNIYKQYFPRLTAIAQSTIDEYAAIVERNRAAGLPVIEPLLRVRARFGHRAMGEHENAMAVEHGPPALWPRDGGRRKRKTRRKRRKRRRTRKKRRRTRKKRRGHRRKPRLVSPKRKLILISG